MMNLYDDIILNHDFLGNDLEDFLEESDVPSDHIQNIIDIMSEKPIIFYGPTEEEFREFGVKIPEEKEYDWEANLESVRESAIRDYRKWARVPEGESIDYKHLDNSALIKASHNNNYDIGDLRGLIKERYDQYLDTKPIDLDTDSYLEERLNSAKERYNEYFSKRGLEQTDLDENALKYASAKEYYDINDLRNNLGGPNEG